MLGDAKERFRNDSEFKKSHTAAVTNQVVEAIPPSGHRFIIDAIYIVGDTAGNVQIQDDTNANYDGLKFYYGANDEFNLEDCNFKLTKNRGIRYTQVGGGNFSVILKYRLEAVE